MTETANLPSTRSAAEDDLALVQRIVAGDRAAFELLMRRHNRRLYRLARATLRDDAEAEDALQDAYLHAYRSLGRFRGDAALTTWLSRLVLNECYGRMRRHARRENVVPMVSSNTADIDIEAMRPSDSEPPDSAVARAEMRALIERKLDELPDSFRTVFILRTVEELSVEETAQCLDIAEATVRSRHFRARSLLREALARDIDLASSEIFGFAGARCDRIVANVMARIDKHGESNQG
ncbi:RNA polymerase sigma factor [Paraburkholderia phenoliruptrix]|uniref:RNA polymerase sigma factor n=1 Tax=Paraburkholderia phenoliruptrix TaxID=252970 RepID=A0ABV3WIE1_9BURK|nr:RNA polymerase sigma factor [Paraburkholderia phenoliruptrix]MDR6391215.1 RNA polymerase sigma-70 factor (ECF subfamily) [Paraburkholderia phenoliruptrix]